MHDVCEPDVPEVTLPDKHVVDKASAWSAGASHTHTQPFYSSLDSVWDNLGEPVAKETFTHSHLS